MKNYQEQVDEWVSQYKIGYWKPHEMIARLTEETGEVAREINHLYGPKPKKSSEETADLEVELADILFTITCMANALDLDLDRGFKKVMDNCYGRDKDRFEKK